MQASMIPAEATINCAVSSCISHPVRMIPDIAIEANNPVKSLCFVILFSFWETSEPLPRLLNVPLLN